MNLDLRMKLLTDLIDALQDNKRPGHDLNHLWAHFFTKRGRLITDGLGVALALDCLMNDVWHFEEFDLTEAFRVEVHTH